MAKKNFATDFEHHLKFLNKFFVSSTRPIMKVAKQQAHMLYFEVFY